MKATQCDRIIKYMNEFGSITQLEAIRELACFRLASRINDIKRKGYNVRTERITLKNRWGEPVRIARYSFAEGENADNRVQSCG